MSPVVGANQSMDERVKEFRSDPQKMEVTTKFVDDVVEKAKGEALRRLREREAVRQTTFDCGTPRKRGRWHSRARGFFSRMFSSFCFCSPETKV